MKAKEFQQILCRAYEPAAVLIKGNVPIPRILGMAAYDFWLFQVEETKDHKAIRSQMLHLEEHGKLNLDE